MPGYWPTATWNTILDCLQLTGPQDRLQNNSLWRLEYITALRAADAGDFSPLLRFVSVDVPQT